MDSGSYQRALGVSLFWFFKQSMPSKRGEHSWPAVLRFGALALGVVLRELAVRVFAATILGRVVVVARLAVCDRLGARALAARLLHQPLPQLRVRLAVRVHRRGPWCP